MLIFLWEKKEIAQIDEVVFKFESSDFECSNFRYSFSFRILAYRTREGELIFLKIRSWNEKIENVHVKQRKIEILKPLSCSHDSQRLIFTAEQ